MNPPFTWAEKFLLLIRLTFLIPWTLLYYVSTFLVISTYRGLPIRRYLTCAFLKVILLKFTSRQIQYLSAPTRKVYQKWIRRKNARAGEPEASLVRGRLSDDVEPLRDGRSALLWVGNRHAAKKFVLFFHGGGYVAPMLPGHLEWCWRSYVEAGVETGIETAVAVLEYTLCPEAQYPVQLGQAVDAFSHLLESGIQPQNLIIGGDSAGGNLAAQLIGHLCDHTPPIAPVNLQRPLAGVFLVSPWLSDKFADESFMENDHIDMLSKGLEKRHRVYYLGLLSVEHSLSTSHVRAFPVDGDLSYLKNMSRVVKEMYVTAGNEEVFRDQVVRYGSEVSQANPSLKVRLDIQKDMAHDFILLEGQDRVNGPCIREMKMWAKMVITEA
ncbi:hypothetical protein QQS21_001316 [Conoideocrella luteorostrata]|uniref:Alpha/beta hydrolase fold-3 domain-containing protein n=1 Tax=Conoideocrella luteorostrata TaxID=1105319 RepID=A0AAJ0CXB9_9HYPO|nr:hypothetical protein QQS21_001316 [Conoideocrella luteorostrata]